MKIKTQCVQQAGHKDPYGAVSPPIYQTATFRQESAVEFGPYDYSRTANPTRSLVESQLARLENGKHASAFASGMAAISAVTRLLKAGDEILAGDDLYGGTVRLFHQVLSQLGITVNFIDATHAEEVRAAITDRTRLILVETPSNPYLRIADIAALSEIARGRDIFLAVDNSMLSPIFQRPLDLGADIVIHSATKYLCGHSDVIAGAVITNNSGIHETIAFHQNAEGAGLSPFDSWLLLRGLKTLALRVEHQAKSALKVAEFLSKQSLVKQVFYPGLPEHPGFELQQKQASGNGGVVCFTTGNADFSRQVAETTKLFSVTVSFGSVTSSISLPTNMSHASVPSSLRLRLAPPEDLIRLSVGIEDVDDLLNDLENALAKRPIQL